MIRLPLQLSERLLKALGVRPHLLALKVEEAPYPEQMARTLLYIEWQEEVRVAAFLCPGCGHRTDVPLNAIQPQWRCSIDLFSRPSLKPNIRHEHGCGREFAIRKGMIRWLSGAPPTDGANHIERGAADLRDPGA